MNRKFGAVSIAALPLLSLFATPAAAQGIGEIGTSLGTAFQSWPTVLLTLAFLLGLWFFIQGWMKLKNHKDDPRENSMGSIMFSLIGGGGLMFIAGMATVFSDSLGLNGNTSAAGYGQFSGIGN